uniref:Splicing factor YJU2 n=2 Tax=Hirondellea gigas TaxID=1518452 RepID=A0A6A7G160_9CRUS
MSERKVLNKYYPPDFDPSKIPRAKCSKNRQFTVRLMAPCNMKCYTCGEYIAKGKKFNARKEDVENMTYIGIRIYRFYIKCPGCLSEISFRTDPETTDYIIEAGAHRNFQALKLAEEQAAKEAQDIKDEIESNPMLLLENRTEQSQYEMDLVESLEDLREMNDRHAGIDLSHMAGKYEKERKLTAEQIEEAERIEACKAMGYEMIEGKLVKRLREDLLDDEPVAKKPNNNNLKASDYLTDGKSLDKSKSPSLKAKLTGLVKKKLVPKDSPTSAASVSLIKTISSLPENNSDEDSIMMPPPTTNCRSPFDKKKELCSSEIMPPPSSNIMPQSYKKSSSPSQKKLPTVPLDIIPSPDFEKTESKLDNLTSSDTLDIPESPTTASSSSSSSPTATNGASSSLSLLGAYSDSSSDED